MEMYKVPDYKKIRVIIDTDAACEADDQYAIAHALMTQKFIVKGITAEHFREEGSESRSYDEIVRVLGKMGREEVPVYHGAVKPLDDMNDAADSEAVRFIISEAMSDSREPLFVFCQGAVTNLAAALIKAPEIASRMTVIAILGGGFPDGGEEYNLCNDYIAANALFASDARLWLVPKNCYTRMRISYAEIQEKVMPCGEIGRYLFEEMQQYACSIRGGWSFGESWCLGDSPVVGLGIDPEIGDYEYMDSPVCDKDGRYIGTNDRKIRVYKNIDSRFVFEDMFAKLRSFYG